MPAKRVGSNVKVVRRKLADGTIREYRYDLSLKAQRAQEAARSDALRKIALEFYQSPEFRNLSPIWQTRQREYIARIEDKLGWMTYDQLSMRKARREFYALRDSMADTPAVADKVMNSLRKLLDFAYERGELDQNHAHGIPWLVPSTKSRADIIVTPEWEKAILDAATPEFRKVCLAAKYSAARMGDLCRFHDSMVKDGWLSFQPRKTLKKTGVWVHLPLFAFAPLEAVLGLGRGYLLMTDHGNPWQPSNLHFNWTETKRRAGLGNADLHFHDWRGTAETALMEAGCTEVEANSVLGHKLVSGSGRKYAARSKEYALNAYRKWSARMSGGGDVVRLFG